MHLRQLYIPCISCMRLICMPQVELRTEEVLPCTYVSSSLSATLAHAAALQVELRTEEVCGLKMSAANLYRWHPAYAAGGALCCTALCWAGLTLFACRHTIYMRRALRLRGRWGASAVLAVQAGYVCAISVARQTCSIFIPLSNRRLTRGWLATPSSSIFQIVA